MSYFGPPIDIIERLADEIGASAKDYPEVQREMSLLAQHLERLAPIYEELCQYCADDNMSADKIKDLYYQYLAF